MKNKRVLALDLGSCAFKMVLLARESGRWHLLEARLLEIPSPVNPATRKAALEQLLEGVSLAKGMEIVSVLDDPFFCLQQVNVPPMPAAELPGAAKWELQRFLTVPPEEMIVDCELLGETEVAGVKKLKLLAAAAPAASIEEHLSFLAQAGVKPTQLVPEAVAVAAWVGEAKAMSDKVVAALLLGGSSTEFLVAQDGKPLFTRKIPFSGLELTRGMTAVLMTYQGQVGLNEQEAETIKRSIGIPRIDSSELAAKGISGVQLLALIRGNLERLAVEVERSLAFYGESAGGLPIQELVLVGGGAHLKGLPEWLTERLKVEVVVPEPVAGISKAPGALQGPAAAVASSLGPALGGGFSAGKGINLLPPQWKEAAHAQLQRAALTGAVTTFLVGALLLRIGMGIYEKTLESQLAAFELEKTASAAAFAQAKVTLAVEEQRADEPQCEEFFKELSQVVPREVYLRGLNLSGKDLTLRGKVRDLGRAPDLVLAEFLRVLGEGGFLGEVRLTSTRQLEGPPKESEFEIRCLLK